MTPAPLLFYQGVAASLGPPLALWMLRRRATRGKEDPSRLQERLGYASLDRPDGPLVWLHAASVGESVSLLPMIAALRAAKPDLTLLVTTATVTSAAMMARSLPQGVLHQYVPVDTRSAVRRFIAHWRPALLCIAESELWPTMLMEAKASGAKLALLSARVSEKSAARWAQAPRSIRALLALFDLITAQDPAVERRLLGLGASRERLKVCGSLKQAAEKLPVSEQELTAWRQHLGERPLWLAASTHNGEETAAISAHQRLAARTPGMLTVIAPRHPERGERIAEEAQAAGLSLTRRSLEQRPTAATDIHLVDSLGELGLWYRLCPVSFVGGSLVDLGGHNPLEPARLGSAVVIGPYTTNVEGECARLEKCEALSRVGGANALPQALMSLLTISGAPSAAALRLSEAGVAATETDSGVADAHLDALRPLLPDRRESQKGARDHEAA